MDLLATLRSKIDRLQEGEHTPGLRAVLSHIEVAFRHLQRGQSENDESAFTDVIYRCNQAFEGSIKEAYRVLANRDPQRTSPFQIETYLDEQAVLRERVLSQFTNYRTEWRNPSAHDYKLNFDESESFLAIVSVCAFACVLLDQIGSKLAYDATVMEVEKSPLFITEQSRTLMELAVDGFKEFARLHSSLSIQTETQLMGALAGFFQSTDLGIDAMLDYRLSKESYERADMVLRRGPEQIIVELKRGISLSLVDSGVLQLQHYMAMSGIDQAILFVFPPKGGELVRQDFVYEAGIGGRVVVLKSASFK